MYNDQTNLILRFSSITSIGWQLCMKGNKLCVTFEPYWFRRTVVCTYIDLYNYNMHTYICLEAIFLIPELQQTAPHKITNYL